jgi:hypothetical protein
MNGASQYQGLGIGGTFGLSLLAEKRLPITHAMQDHLKSGQDNHWEEDQA